MNDTKEITIYEAKTNHTSDRTSETMITPNSNISLASGTSTQTKEITGIVEFEELNLPIPVSVKGLRIGFKYKSINIVKDNL